MNFNREERLLIAANYLFQCRCDWSDSRKIRYWLECAKDFLPPEMDAIDEDYIHYTQEDGRTARDATELNYEDIISNLDWNKISQEAIDYCRGLFKWTLTLK